MPSLNKIFPHASQDCLRLNAALQNAKPKRYKTTTLGGSVSGKNESVPRVTVRFTGKRVRPLDPDNFAGGCKDLLDGLRHSGIISGDEAWRINFVTRQEKVKHRSEEKTVIEVEIP